MIYKIYIGDRIRAGDDEFIVVRRSFKRVLYDAWWHLYGWRKFPYAKMKEIQNKE